MWNLRFTCDRSCNLRATLHCTVLQHGSRTVLIHAVKIYVISNKAQQKRLSQRFTTWKCTKISWLTYVILYILTSSFSHSFFEPDDGHGQSNINQSQTYTSYLTLQPLSFLSGLDECAVLSKRENNITHYKIDKCVLLVRQLTSLRFDYIMIVTIIVFERAQGINPVFPFN